MGTKYQNLDVSHLVLQLSLPSPLNPGVKLRMKGAAPTGEAPITSEWSTILLPKEQLISEVWQYSLNSILVYLDQSVYLNAREVMAVKTSKKITRGP